MDLLPQRKGPVVFFVAGFIFFLVAAIVMFVVMLSRHAMPGINH